MFLLILAFVLSGCAALIYEVVWFQMLELVIGSSAISLGILLGAFMGGMCLGSLLMPALQRRDSLTNCHPLRIYSYIELLIGSLGLLLLAVIPLVGTLYLVVTPAGIVGVLARGIITGICLLPPAMLMGATLPAVAHWVETASYDEDVRGALSVRERSAGWLGLFYAGNIVGAVAGSLLAAFVLLRFFDVTTATLAAVALNAAAAALSWIVSRHEPAVSRDAMATPPNGFPRGADGALSYISIGLSGFTALACEVIWTRQLSLFSGATVFVFAMILAVFLAGLAGGAMWGAAWARRTKQPDGALAICQTLLAVAIAWAAYQLAVVLPFWPIDFTRMSDPWYKLRFDLLRTASAALPATILWGASFPLAVASAMAKGAHPSRSAAYAYGANTLGAIVGALAASIWMIPHFGSAASQSALILTAAVSAIIALAPWQNRVYSGQTAKAALPPLLALVALHSVPEISPDVLAYGRLVVQTGRAQVLYAQEGIASTVAVSRTANGVLNYHGAGKVQASTEYQDMRLQRILGHLTTLATPTPRRFLVIGFGAGITAGAVSIEPRMEQTTIVEIEPLVPEKIAPYFREYNFDLVHNPRARVVIDDGRHYLLTTRETFDGITSDPLDPWVRGTAALYTREFFEQARRRLNPGGVMTQFVQLYESNEDAVRSEMATFFEVFPEGLVFANSVMGQGYDLVLLGQATPVPINVDTLEARLDQPEYAHVAKSLEELGFYSASDLLGTYVARAADLREWLAGAVINRDRNLRLQYLAGLGLNEKSEVAIYNRMMANGPRFSPEVFTGSASLMEYLKRAVESGSSR